MHRLTIEGDARLIASVANFLAQRGDDATFDAPAAPTLPTDAREAVYQALAPAAMPAAPVAAQADEDDNAPANPNAPAVDSSGLPWDERIHAATKATTGDGKWRKRRGVNELTVSAVEAELRARAGVPAPIPTPPSVPANVPSQPVPMPPLPMPSAAPAPVAAQPLPMPAAPVATVPPMPAATTAPEPLATATAQAAGTLDFAGFMQHLSAQMAKRDAAGAPLIHADYLNGVTAEIGTAFGKQLSAITDVASEPNMINYAVQIMQRDGRW